MKQKKTLVIGASENPERYAYKAINALLQKQHTVEAIGNKTGDVGGVLIHTTPMPFQDIDTVTLYLNPKNQKEYYQYIIDLHPRRVIFNPGTENKEFYASLLSHDIQVEEACTLVLLATHQY